MPPRARAKPATLPLGGDPKVEQFLQQYGVQYELHTNVPIAQIDVKGSLSNQARFKSLDDATVAMYAGKLQDGTRFPPVVAYRANRGKAPRLTIVDGNHRTAAHQRVKQPLDVYVLGNDTPPDIIQFLTFESNLQNGLSYSEDERVSHAADMVENHSVSQKVAAQRYGVAPSKLGFVLSRREADRRAIEADIDSRIWDGIVDTTRVRLNAIRNDDILELAATLVHQARLGTLEAGKLVSELTKLTSSKAQQDVLKAKRAALADRIQAAKAGKKAGGGTHSPKHRLALGLSQLVGLPTNVDAIDKMFSGDERIETAERLAPVVELLNDLLERLQAA